MGLASCEICSSHLRCVIGSWHIPQTVCVNSPSPVGVPASLLLWTPLNIAYTLLYRRLFLCLLLQNTQSC